MADSCLNDINSNMISLTHNAKRLRDHTLLRITESSIENVQGSDMIGISTVVAPDTLKILSSPVFSCHQPTARTCPGGVSGIHGYKTNTVLLGQLRDPCHDLPVCPWGNRFTEIFRTIFSFTFFQIFKIFNTQNPYRFPGKPFKDLIDVILSLGMCPGSGFAAGLFSLNRLNNFFYARAILSSIRIYNELIKAYVYTQSRAFFHFGGRNFHPDPDPVISQDTALFNFSSWLIEPIIQTFMGLKRDDYGMTLGKTGNFKNIVERALSFFDFGHEAGQSQGSIGDDRFSGISSKSSGGFSISRENFHSPFQGILAMSVGQRSSLEPVQGFGIEGSRIFPQGIDEELDGWSELSFQGLEFTGLDLGDLIQGYFYGTVHKV